MRILLLSLLVIIVTPLSSDVFAETGLSVPQNNLLKSRLVHIYTKIQHRVDLLKNDHLKNPSTNGNLASEQLEIQLTREACRFESVPFEVFQAVKLLLTPGIVTFISDYARQNKDISQSLLKSHKNEIKKASQVLLSSKVKHIGLMGRSLHDKANSLVGLSAYLDKKSNKEYHILNLNSQAFSESIIFANLDVLLSRLMSYLDIKIAVHINKLGGEIGAGKPMPAILQFLLSARQQGQVANVPFFVNFSSEELDRLKKIELSRGARGTVYQLLEPDLTYLDIKPLTIKQSLDLVNLSLPKIEAKYSVSVSEDVARAFLKIAPVLFPDKDIFSSVNKLLIEIIEASDSKEISLKDAQAIIEKNYDKTNLFNRGLSGVDLSNKKEVMEVVLRVGDLINNELIGQSDAVTKVSQAIESHYMKEERKTPLSIFAVGLTGVGKTELGNLISKHLYGSNSFANFSLGNFSHIGDLNNLFGSAKGYIGSDDVSELEKFLSKSPAGGVIIFDEASNMGGESQEQKNAMFKRFYELLEEGKWTAPKSGVTYELGNYVFLFTGNDGEKIFQGINNEAYKEMLWKQNSSREKIFNLLTEVGVPEAFLGRLNEVFLFKPVTKKTATAIAKKFMKGFEKNYAVTVTYSNKEQFFKNLIQAVFFASEGARSVRNFIENRLGSYVIRVAEGALKKGEVLKSVKLGWTDNLKGRVYAAKSFNRISQLSVSISTDIKPKYTRATSLNVSGDILKVDLPTKLQIRETAYHEAGHGFLSGSKQTGKNLEFITVVPGKTSKGLSYLGVAAYDIDSFTGLTYKNLITRVAGLLAGGMAEKMAGFNLSSGWSNDLLQARKLIQAAFLTGPVLDGKGLEFIRVEGSEDKLVLTKAQERTLQKEVEKVISLAKIQVKKTLTSKWSNVEQVVDILLEKGTITAKEFHKIENDKSIRVPWELDSNLKMHKLTSCKSLF